MIDIVIFCLTVDHNRAGKLLDALREHGQSGKYRIRFVSSDPIAVSWNADKDLARSAACVLMCWSATTSDPAHAAYVRFGGELVQCGSLLSIELDDGSIPASVASASRYKLYEHRLGERILSWMLIGDAHRSLIVAAAIEKADGRDPPAASTVNLIRHIPLIRRILWVGGPIALLSSLIGIASYVPLQKAFAPTAMAKAYHDAEQSGDCDRMARFSSDHPSSPWANDAIEFQTRCTRMSVQVDEQYRTEVRAGQIDLQPAPDKTTARAQAAAKIRSLADERCAAYASVVHAKLRNVSVDGLKQICGSNQNGSICESEAWAVCHIRRTEPPAPR